MVTSFVIIYGLPATNSSIIHLDKAIKSYLTFQRPSICSIIRLRHAVRRVCCWAPWGQQISIGGGGRPANGGFRRGCGCTPFGVLQKNSGSTNFEIVSTADSAIIIIINFYIAASSHEIFLRVGGREGMKVLGALQRHQLPHPLAKILDPPLRPAAATPQHGP